jgi:NAD(P)-dependent dehydrogenase (short-subunit alcohol dehydrogenase family)
LTQLVEIFSGQVFWAMLGNALRGSQFAIRRTPEKNCEQQKAKSDCIVGVSMQISGKSFIVTGGASGLGRAAAEAILAAQGQVVLLDVNPENGQETARALGSHAVFAQADVTSEEQVKAAVDLTVSAFGRLDGVVNAAGIGPAAKVLGRNGPHPLDLFEKTIRVNLIGTFNVIRLAAAVLAQNAPSEAGERGVIINTASIAAFDGQIGQSAYAASKGGIVGLTLPVAREFASLGIRVVTIAPGIFDTPLLAALPEPARVSLGQQVPFPSRLGRPSEYAALARHIIENEMLNGEVIRLDGALRMAPK